MSRTRTLRSSLTALTLLAGLLVALVVPAGSASAAAYRYWAYFQLGARPGSSPPRGRDQTKPADGSSRAGAFAVAGESTPAHRGEHHLRRRSAATKADPAKKRWSPSSSTTAATADQEDGSAPPAPAAKGAVRAERRERLRGARRRRHRPRRQGAGLRPGRPPGHGLRQPGQGRLGGSRRSRHPDHVGPQGFPGVHAVEGGRRRRLVPGSEVRRDRRRGPRAARPWGVALRRRQGAVDAPDSAR